jgi:hypothetical protein
MPGVTVRRPGTTIRSVTITDEVTTTTVEAKERYIKETWWHKKIGEREQMRRSYSGLIHDHGSGLSALPFVFLPVKHTSALVHSF